VRLRRLAKAMWRCQRLEIMRRSVVSLLLLSLPAWHDAALATDAFVPPEVTSSKNYTVGLQMELAGRVHHADSADSREKKRAFCNGWGKPYVNPVPIDDVGRVRKVVVQMDGSSYVWTETKVASLLDSFGCEFGPKTLRVLTIARYDGKQTHEKTYNYDTRTTGGRVVPGDHTYFGSNSPHVPPPPDQLAKIDVGQQRTIVGLPCTVRRFVPGSNEMTYCATAAHPVRGRARPLSLAIRIGTLDLEATSITPDVKVDAGVFDGPPGFKPFKKSRTAAEQEDDTPDKDSGRPRSNRRTP
jgi:hypothetical protein